MENLTCFVCSKNINGGLNGLVDHIKFLHGLSVNRKYGNSTFECGQSGCRRRFNLFNSMRQHIKKHHLPNYNEHEDVDNNDFGDEENYENVAYDDPMQGNINMADVDIIDENAAEEGLFDLRQSVVRMVGRMQAKPSMTGNNLTDMLDECEELVLSLVNHLKGKVTNFFQDRNMIDVPEVVELIDHFSFESPFEGLRTLKDQIKSLEAYCKYIPAKEIPLNKRFDSRLDRETEMFLPTLVVNSYQYVSIIDVLTVILSNKNVKEAILTEQPSEDGILNSSIDGKYYKSHEFFQRFPHAIRIQLYNDDIEVTNPIGSKTGVHKLSVWYYTIQNLPTHMYSASSNIHVLCICFAKDVKRYGVREVLKAFFYELEKLESDEGVTIKLDDEDFVLRASIAAFCGDTLAVHDVFGLLGPSANKFCRMCLISRRQLHEGNMQTAQPRTKEVFDTHLAALTAPRANVQFLETENGVRNDCALHVSKYFHISENKIFDPMHDLLSGVGPMILKLVIYQFVCEDEFFDLEYINSRISAFNYGPLEKKNKPSANLIISDIRNINDHSLKQKAMQMWCFLRVFPFLVIEKVPRGNKHMNLILIFLRILEIVMAPKLTVSILTYLRHLIR